jgi:hypothetical protein
VRETVLEAAVSSPSPLPEGLADWWKRQVTAAEALD